MSENAHPFFTSLEVKFATPNTLSSATVFSDPFFGQIAAQF